MNGFIVFAGLVDRGFGGVLVLVEESVLGDTVGFSFDGPVVCGESE